MGTPVSLISTTFVQACCIVWCVLHNQHGMPSCVTLACVLPLFVVISASKRHVQGVQRCL